MAMRPPVGAPTLTRRTRILLVVAAILVLLLLGGARLINFYVDWLWFGEVGYRDVFTTVLFTRIVQFLVGAAADRRPGGARRCGSPTGPGRCSCRSPARRTRSPGTGR